MIVVSDASPLHYLILVEQVDLLPRFFGKILIPTAVQDELNHDNTPTQVSTWMANLPEWLEVGSPQLKISPTKNLHQGECDAIALAKEESIETILIDDHFAREFAKQVNLTVKGTAGILVQASQQGLVDLKNSLDELRSHEFRLADQLYNEMLSRYVT